MKEPNNFLSPLQIILPFFSTTLNIEITTQLYKNGLKRWNYPLEKTIAKFLVFTLKSVY